MPTPSGATFGGWRSLAAVYAPAALFSTGQGAVPELTGALAGQRQHEADRGASLDAVDQHVGQAAYLRGLLGC